MLDEIETQKVKSDSSKYSKSSCGTKDDLTIFVKDLTVKWDPVCFSTTTYTTYFLLICYLFIKSHSQPTLDHITINAKKGDLVCVIGSVGSGKVKTLLFIPLIEYFIHFYRLPF